MLMVDIGDYLNLKKMMMVLVILNLLVEEITNNLPRVSTKESIPVKEKGDEKLRNCNIDEHNETLNFVENELSESKILKK